MEALRDEVGADHAAICDLMRQLLPLDARVVRDTTVPGYMWGNRLLPIVAPRTSIRAANAAIGPGVPMAIGAALGTGKPTVVIQGDGGLMLSIGEISSLAEHGLPVIVCVFNDGGYGVLRIIQDALWDTHHGTEIGGIDFVGVAQAMGVPAERVASVVEFEAAFSRAVDRASGASGPVGPTPARHRPHRVDPDHVPAARAPGAAARAEPTARLPVTGWRCLCRDPAWCGRPVPSRASRP